MMNNINMPTVSTEYEDKDFITCMSISYREDIVQ